MKFSYLHCLAMMLFVGLCGVKVLGSDAESSRGVLGQATDGLIVCAHRGWLAPSEAENSLTTMQRTVSTGPFMVEMDLHESRDGTIFMLHDSSVDRTTDGTGTLAELTDAAIAPLRLKLPDGRVTAEPIPRFEQIARWAEATPAALLMLDIKDTPPKDVMAIVRRHRLTSRVVLLTFSRDNALQALVADPDVLISVLAKTPADIDDYITLAAGRRLAIYVPQDADSDLFFRAHSKGGFVISDAITTIAAGALDSKLELSSPDVYRDFLRQRPVDVLVTNHPQTVAMVTKKR